MPRINALDERNKVIYKEYKKIYAEKFLRNERILELLSKKYFLSPQTIFKIVLQEKKVHTK